MRRSGAIPFSTASAFMASRISRDMSVLLLDEVGSADVGVRDGDDPVVGGDGDLRVVGADELAGEGRVAVAGVAGANPGAAAEEAAVVRRLGQRALAARRGDLERVGLADVRKQVGDALAELERNAFGMIDEEPHG